MPVHTSRSPWSMVNGRGQFFFWFLEETDLSRWRIVIKKLKSVTYYYKTLLFGYSAVIEFEYTDCTVAVS